MFIMSLIVNTGMCFERFVIVVTSLTATYLPSSWGTYRATRWDYMTLPARWDCLRSCSSSLFASCP